MQTFLCDVLDFKDIGLPAGELRALAQDIRSNGQKVMLEVVSCTRDEELNSVRAGIELGADYILGGIHAADAAAILAGAEVEYMPFPGRVVGHPSVLCGAPEEIVSSAVSLSALDGIDGLNLLAYRFSGDVEQLIRSVVDSVNVPVIAAGSIASEERIRTVVQLGVWGFTVGTAVFENAFQTGQKGVRGQIEAILAAAVLRQRAG